MGQGYVPCASLAREVKLQAIVIAVADAAVAVVAAFIIVACAGAHVGAADRVTFCGPLCHWWMPR